MSQLEVTENLLKDLGASDKPTIYVYNKCDIADTDLWHLPEGTPLTDEERLCRRCLREKRSRYRRACKTP